MLETGIFFGSYGYPDLSFEDILRAVADAGFQTITTGVFDQERMARLAHLCPQYGLRYESVHAPFGGISKIWKATPEGEEWIPKLSGVAELCARLEIPYYTLHCVNTGEYNNNGPYGSLYSEIGLERFRAIITRSEEMGAKASFENVEFPQRELKSLTEALKNSSSEGWGITWDVGHWNCYPCQLDFKEVFGDRLLGTHIHDNFGMKDPQVITWNDDCHLLPFDGTLDYRQMGKTLKALSYTGSLTLEVGRGRQMPWYEEYQSLEDFLRVAHERVRQLACLCR